MCYSISIMKLFSLLVILLLFLYLSNTTAEAKTLPQAKAGKQTSISKRTGSGINVSPRLRADRKALLTYFSNLQNAKSVSYTLTYTTNGQAEGAGGSLTLDGGTTATRELLFGTCSKNVCRYHTNISNMKLEVGYTSTSGKKYLKRYRIKI